MENGQRLRRLREVAGITQGVLSERMGYPRQKELCLRETGERTMTSADFLRGVAALDALVAERNAAWVEARYVQDGEAAS